MYRARDERLQREVAIKVLPHGLVADEVARKRFHKEALSLSRLNHPNIATVYDFDTHEGMDFIVMEYVPGETLDSRIAKGPLPEKEILGFGMQLADGLTAAHEQGVVHRDLKPGNLRVTPDGRLKILDFGVAKLVRSEVLSEADATRSITENYAGVMGTLPYMAPEQLRGEEALDARTDIYAIGAVVHEMLTGKKVFEGDGPFAVMCAQMEQIPQQPSALNPEVPAALDSVVAQALAKDPLIRFQSAHEFRIALEAGLSNVSYSAAPAPRLAYKHDSRSNRFPLSRLTKNLVLSLASVITVVGTVVVLPPNVEHMVGRRLPPQTLSTPASMTQQQVANAANLEGATAAVNSSQVSMDSGPSSSSAAPSVASSRQAGPQARAAKSPTPTFPPKPSPPDDSVSQTAEQAKPQRNGNRFIRALSKLNPFHRGLKNDSVEPTRAGPTESTAK